MNVPSEDEFAAWCEHTVTRFVATAWAGMAVKLRDQVTGQLWATGKIDELALAEARGEAKAYLSLLHATRSDYGFINQNPG